MRGDTKALSFLTWLCRQCKSIVARHISNVSRYKSIVSRYKSIVSRYKSTVCFDIAKVWLLTNFRNSERANPIKQGASIRKLCLNLQHYFNLNAAPEKIILPELEPNL